jgi:mono/diheme cytochrome c family protein
MPGSRNPTDAPKARRHGLTRFLVATGAAALVGASAAGAAAGAWQAAPASRSVWDGVYTDAQADRGEGQYGRTCAHCHGLALEGDGAREIPALASDSFMRHWRGRPVQALFDALMRSMPADDLGTLSPRTTADLIAYLLRVNGAPPGEMSLPSERELLASVVIDRRP